MNPEQETQALNLYKRIQEFSFDKPDAQLSFSQRLARENGWSLAYAKEAIEEYKKFTFLAVAAGHPVTPSDQVDQVWHLHLTYTRSYWDEFCPQVLQTPLHHDPTLGGATENQKFNDWYSKTLESYEKFFGIKPPTKLWPSPDDRFGRDLHFLRVNTQQNQILAKSKIKKVFLSLFILVTLFLSGCYVTVSENQLDALAEVSIAVISIAAILGLIRFIWQMVDSVKNPRTPRTGGYWTSQSSDFESSDSNSAACGTFGGGWGDVAGGHSGSNGGGGCSSDGGGSDSGGSDSGGSDGGGCGGGGCGGGGCGGGGCGGGGCGGGGCGGG